MNSDFIYYSNVFLYAASLKWGIEVNRFDLTPKQSQAAFAFSDILQHVHASTRKQQNFWMPQQVILPMHVEKEPLPMDKRDLSNADIDAELPKPYANARAVRKRGASSRWAEKFCHLLEGFIEASTQENSHPEWPSEFNQQ